MLSIAGTSGSQTDGGPPERLGPVAPFPVGVDEATRLLLLLLCVFSITCSQPRGQRWDGGSIDHDGSIEIICGGDPEDDFVCDVRTEAEVLVGCEEDHEFFRIFERDCTAEGLVCVDDPPYDDCLTLERLDAPIIGCAICRPCAQGCFRNNVSRCLPDGSGWEIIDYCDTGRGEICSQGRCGNGCELAERYASNVGCEYYAVDLDNAVVRSGSAAAQQFAVVVSNPSPLQAHVMVERCLGHPCEDESNREAIRFGGEEEVIINPDDLETFALDAAEVDGSPPGVFDNGTHSALTHRAYRITSSVPIVVYQFNPYDNSVNVFSNDASLLIPVTALGNRYTVLSWPQTIAYTPSDPDTDMELDLRAFLTIVGTEPDTNVRIRLAADVVPSGDEGFPIRRSHAGETVEFTLGPFDVLNLESGYYLGRDSFNADFTGTYIESSAPIAVFSGSEASDVPSFDTLSDRQCCADHLEQQLPPDHTLGFSFVVPHTPPRTQAVAAAGASVTPLDREPEWYRVLAVRDDTIVTTTVTGYEEFRLHTGESMVIESENPFILRATNAVAVGQFVGSQWTTGMTASDLPGGDPAFIIVPPIEQWRRSYVFLTPDKYAFDFVMVMVTRNQLPLVTYDGEPMATRSSCTRQRADGLRDEDPHPSDYFVITCALSDPIITEGLPRPDNVDHNIQEDGVHEVRVEGEGVNGIGLVVYGFDSYVSYGYAGGTDLRLIQ